MKKQILIIVISLFFISLIFAADNVQYNYKIISGEDDSFETNGNMNLNASNVVMGKEWGNVYRGGYKFKLNVTKGAKISNATLSLAYNWRSGTKPSIILYGENIGNSNPFSSIKNDISSRLRTNSNIKWNNLGKFSWGKYTTSPDIRLIIQEIVNRPDYNSGNYITILAYENPTTSDEWEAISYEGTSWNKGIYSANLKIIASVHPQDNPSICGNGIVEIGEVCDSNTNSCTINGYSGNSLCNSECTGFGICQTTQFCGDGIKNGNEFCDDGSLNGQPNKCNLQCSGITSSICGNNILEVGEQCDDGNLANGDGCSSICFIEIPTNISKGIVIINMDDIQYSWLQDVSVAVTQVNIEEGVDIVLNTIPIFMESSTIVRPKLIEWNTNYSNIVEIAQHGYTHNGNEYNMGSMSYLQQKTIVENGLNVFKSLGIIPTLFTPPGGSQNLATLQVLQDLGFNSNLACFSFASMDSTNIKVLKQCEALLCDIQGVSGPSCNFKTSQNLMQDIDASISNNRYAVVVFHIQDFQSPVTFGIDNNKVEKYRQILRDLKASNKYQFMTPREYRNSLS